MKTALGAVFTGCFLSSFFVAPLNARQSPAPRASFLDRLQVIRIDGVLKAGGQPVQEGFYAAAGTRLDLSAGGVAVLDFSGQGAVRLQGPATLQITGGRRPGVNLVRGKLLGALGGLKSAFTVRARAFDAIVTDGDFYIDLVGRDEMYLCACRGTVQMTDDQPDGYRKIINGEHHRGVGYRFTRMNGRISAMESDHEFEGHSDEQLDALRALK